MPGLHSFRNMSADGGEAQEGESLEVETFLVLASRRQRPSQVKVRSTIQRLGSATKPVA